jgi:hypothetical protein
VRALGVTVASAVLGASSIVALVLITVLAHLNKVKSTVYSAGQLRNIHIESEFFASESKHFVVAGVLHHIHSAANVLGVLAICDQGHFKLGARAGNTIGATERILVNTVESAVFSTGCAIGANASVPGSTRVAV